MIDFATLFDRLGAFFQAGDSIVSAVGADVPENVAFALENLGANLGVDYEQVSEGLRLGLSSFQSTGSAALASLVQSPTQHLLRLTARDDNPNVTTVAAALRELIAQMEDEAESVDANTVAASVTYNGANVGNGVAIASTKRGDGRVCEHIFAETIELEVTAVAADGSATFSVIGEPLIAAISPLWPGGSGVSRSVTSRVSATSNLLQNPGFEESDSYSSNLPKYWIAPVATLGVTFRHTPVEVQTIVLSGTPEEGYYLLHWVNAAGDQQTTIPLAYNASATAVQAALRALVGLEQVTVSSSGTSPDLTHTVTFIGVPNPAELTSTSGLTGELLAMENGEEFLLEDGDSLATESTTSGIAHATTIAGSAYVLRGARAVELDSNGSQLTVIMQPVTLDPATQYAACVFAKVDVVPAAGVLTVDLVDGVGGTVLADDEGVSCSYTFNAADLTTSWAAKTGFFRTPTNMPATCFFRVRISTAVSTGTSVYLDEAWLGEPDELYTDGVSLALFTGATEWETGDRAEIAVTNDRAGLLHEWANRVFSLRENRLLLPSNSAGAETIQDELAMDAMLLETNFGLLLESGESFLLE